MIIKTQMKPNTPVIDEVFRLCLGPYPDTIDPRKIRTVSTYVILRQCSRSLTNYNQSGQLVGDLAERWQFSKDFTSIKFWLKKEARWSDGTPVLATDLKSTLMWLKESKQAVHFEMNLIKNMLADAETIEFTFTRPMPSFLHAVSHPEFSPYEVKNDSVDLGRTVGPYIITSKPESPAELEPNNYYSWDTQSRPRHFTSVHSETYEEAAQHLKNNKCDLSLVKPLKSGEDLELYNKFGIHAHPLSLGFTYFAALASPNLTQDERLYIANLLMNEVKEVPLPGLTNTQNIFLNDGPGRISKAKLASLWNKIKKQSENTKIASSKVIYILSQNSYEIGSVVLNILRKNGIKAELDFYENQDQFAEMSKTGKYSILINNNDFSSIDLAENLQVTFNSSRPLVQLGQYKDYFQSMLAKLEAESGETRADLTEQIGYELIEKGLVVPLYHSSLYLFLSNRLNSDDFSRVGFELPLQKLRINK